VRVNMEAAVIVWERKSEAKLRPAPGRCKPSRRPSGAGLSRVPILIPGSRISGSEAGVAT